MICCIPTDVVSYTVTENSQTATGSASVQLDAGPSITAQTPTTVQPGQTTVIGTATPGLPGDTLTLKETAGTGTLSLGAVQADGTQQVIYTAPAKTAKSSTDQVAYTVADQHNDAIASATANVSLAAAKHDDKDDTIILDRDHMKFVLHDADKMIFLRGSGADIDDLSKGMHLVLDGNPGKLSLSDFDKDLSGVIDLRGGLGGFTSAKDIMAALHSDDHGGTMLSFGQAGSLDFSNVAPSSLHASSFQIG